MNKVVKGVGIAIAVYFAICVIGAVGMMATRSGDATNLTAEQEVEAQKLASESYVTHKDGSLTSLSLKDAEMMVDTCSYLRTKKFSDMTPEMLSIWDTCRSKGVSR